MITLGGERSLDIPEIQIGMRDRIAIVGENGAGKTTLLTALVQQLSRRGTGTDQDDALRYLYIPQEYDRADRDRLITRLHRLSAKERGNVVSFLSRMDSDPERVVNGVTSSPGEARKLALAIGALHPLSAIILDEPTNHFDLPAIVELEDALVRFSGALVVVGHDQQFLDAICETYLEVGEGRVQVRG
jgi:ATPase subunit of ABC transporter with duplicated ATPase domains